MDVKGYYKTLGITDEERNLPKDQFNELCKKKYRALCLKWHPDRWATGTDEEKKKAEEEFKKVAEAYDTLGDEQKKQQYDNGFSSDGEDFGQDAGGFGGFDATVMDWLRQRGFGHFGGFTNQGKPQGHKGRDIDAYVTITFAESLQEHLEKEVTVKKKVVCPDCNGTGSEDGQQHKCSHCNGTGWQTRTTFRNGIQYTDSQTCPYCGGTGREITNPCKKCGGSGFIEKEEKMTLTLPGGHLTNGISVIYGHMGENGTPGYPKGDLILHVTVTQETPGYFITQPRDRNIYHEEKVDFADALLGTNVTVKCPDGSDWTIKLRECTQPGERFTKNNGGYLDNDGYTAYKGDYIVVISYKVPSKLTKEQKKALENYKKEK